MQGFRQIQTQKQLATQTLSPQQILVVKLLELPAVELEDRIRGEILENPALEEGHEESVADEVMEEEFPEQGEDEANDYDVLADYLNEDDIPDYKTREHNSESSHAESIPFSEVTSFYETLKEQLAERELTPHEKELVEYLIGSLDDDGLLRKSLTDIGEELAIYMGIDSTGEELTQALITLQGFDPPGIGASNLQECLLLQIERKKHNQTGDCVLLQERIIKECYTEFTGKHWDKICKKLNIDQDTLQAAIGEITRLNPRPGASLGEAIGHNFQQIVPDFIVERYDDETLTLSLNNQHIPELRINREFKDLLATQNNGKGNATKKEKDATLFVKQKVEAAQNFINAIKQRQNTLITTMRAIIDIQRPFFLQGNESLIKPMILKDIAERTKLDISTVSRVSNSKFVQTDFGIYPLKFFFNDGYTTSQGEELSVREIHRILKECVNTEDKAKPFTDDELSDILSQKGYPIARRTIAKYRQQLHIPVARLRK